MGNLLTWLRLPMKTGYLTGFKCCALTLDSGAEAAGESNERISLPALDESRQESERDRKKPEPKRWAGRPPSRESACSCEGDSKIGRILSIPLSLVSTSVFF